MRVEHRENWNVEQHNEHQKVVVAESHIQCVRHAYTPKIRLFHVIQRMVDAEKFSSNSNGVQNNEQSIPEPLNNESHAD